MALRGPDPEWPTKVVRHGGLREPSQIPQLLPPSQIVTGSSSGRVNIVRGFDGRGDREVFRRLPIAAVDSHDSHRRDNHRVRSHERPAIKPHARAISCPLGADVMDGERRVSVRTLESGMDSTSANDSVQSQFPVNSTERCNLVTGTVTWFSRIRLLR